MVDSFPQFLLTSLTSLLICSELSGGDDLLLDADGNKIRSNASVKSDPTGAKWALERQIEDYIDVLKFQEQLKKMHIYRCEGCSPGCRLTICDERGAPNACPFGMISIWEQVFPPVVSLLNTNDKLDKVRK